ncbi:hypothetical protein GO594_07405 [Pseudomonas otitidis]|uniref:Bro-N domain-containing protein n=1 Tax=Metapseudomonas otitidis TaxID=319939 RepID=A0A7X3H5M6_9GAMM|nr:hypothetical protein [Pseudomonas otitidis]
MPPWKSPGFRGFDEHLLSEKPRFVAVDVATALQYTEASKMTRNLDGDEKGLHNVVTHGGVQEMLIINESGLYSAALDTRNSGYLEPSLKPRSRGGLFVCSENHSPCMDLQLRVP